MNDDKFIFVHVPKTAGTTFIRILDKLYIGNTGRDYKNKCGKKTNYVEDVGVDNCKIIYGHFSSEKYLYLNRKQISIIRDPVERIISEYFYKSNNAKNIIDYVINKEFFAVSEVRSLNVIYDYIKDINRFSFIGLTERFEDTLNQFEKLLNVKIHRNFESRKINKNKGIINKFTKQELKRILHKDYEIYNAVIKKWWS
jgi:hypothetical protein